MTIELKGLSREQVTNLLPEGLISLCWRGSVAHGMYVPKSDPDSIDDKDVMGVYIAPIEFPQLIEDAIPFAFPFFVYVLPAKSQVVFIGLLLNCNPNVLSLLWLKANGIIYESPLGRLLRENRDLFVTKKAYHSFSGYAHDQFKKMISFNQEAQALMRELERQLLELDIDPDSALGHYMLGAGFERAGDLRAAEVIEAALRERA